jgi:tRNA (guanine37-N1)-methyltransferase
MRLDVLTLFPDIFSGYLSQSLLKLAIERSLVEVSLHNIRDWATDKHRMVDDRPFGGGPGMVLKPEPVVEAVEAVQQMAGSSGQTGSSKKADPGHLVMLTPQGRRLDQAVVEELATHDRILLLCGRYEGFDQRISDLLEPDEISIGDYVLNGGEVAAMAIIDAIIRLVPGVLGDIQSNQRDSFTRGLFGHRKRVLEHAQYTRPREYRGKQVPEVLLSGNHQQVAQWREQNSLERTIQHRADLLSDN